MSLQAGPFSAYDIGRMILGLPSGMIGGTPQAPTVGAPPVAQTSVYEGAPQQPTEQKPKRKGLGGLADAIRDPRVQMFLTSVGYRMSQPKNFGQTGWGRASEALVGGYNTLAMADEMRRQREQATREETRKQQTHEAGLKESEQQVAASKATVNQNQQRIDREAAQDLWRKKVDQATIDLQGRGVAVQEKKLDQDIIDSNRAAETAKGNLQIEMEKLGTMRQQGAKEIELRAQANRVAAAQAAANIAESKQRTEQSQYEMLLGVKNILANPEQRTSQTALASLMKLRMGDTFGLEQEELDARTEEAYTWAQKVLSQKPTPQGQGTLNQPAGGGAGATKELTEEELRGIAKSEGRDVEELRKLFLGSGYKIVGGSWGGASSSSDKVDWRSPVSVTVQR